MTDMKWLKRHKSKLFLVLVGLLGLGSIIPVRLAIARHQAPTPQAILVLEGQTDRIRFAAQFSTSHPTLPVWVSGNSDDLRLNQSIFQQAGVPAPQVHYDVCATDTVTNFTCNVDVFAAQKIQHVYLITSNCHMPRSRAIATIVFGSRGIAVTPVSVPTPQHAPESPLRIARDCLRSLLWLVTGWTGANLRRLER
jgi:uncharacterized SAM-binding protein YcdF (DUF218 family)